MLWNLHPISRWYDISGKRSRVSSGLSSSTEEKSQESIVKEHVSRHGKLHRLLAINASFEHERVCSANGLLVEGGGDANCGPVACQNRRQRDSWCTS
ncbi:hypothetical protein PoB_007617000 [Plakobranchus ocellatus]|uniref:Uncharacterized protein n=1 Tax=Plakobranchus ocellatus TaxID=259542 RepID=A0AAV4E010_9GAST|nr:hypothetical protein PoB_007617000 [Plakobranchus ocellatus]